MENVSVRVNKSVNGPLHTQQPQGPAKKTLGWIAAAVVTVLIIAAIVWLCLGGNGAARQINANEYQSVFFTNGQVYFGKLQTLSGGYYKLTDIFYLQTKNSTSNTNNPQQSANNASDVQLIKLGNEIHGPEDAMVFPKQQLLFFENLKKDGKVAQSIDKYSKK